ncbi:MAG: nitrogen assimilation regulatory protein [Pirellulaceae bacterium]|nr:MAG: nitrogen assimilation regulatory protein [Pirellulaceae bacterium]
MSRFLVVDDEPADLALLEGIIRKMGHDVLTASNASDALQIVRDQAPDVVILDILLPDENGLEVFSQMRSLRPRMPIVFVTASSSSNVAIEAMQRGALDYLTKPVHVPKARQAIERALEVVRMSNEPVRLDPPPVAVMEGDAIIGRSAAMQEVYKSIGLVASQDVNVLIRGESGTGKELVARAIYQFSKRSEAPFLAVNCAAIPEPLLESELFGHEKGAFTGADRRRVGKFEQCNKGTLFLDEIGDMPLVLQGKILRVLQDGTFQRVGGNQTIQTDVRVIAATHRDLESMVELGQFREDLLYRLNGFTITLPPLRERGEDLELLIEYFRRQANKDLGKQVQGLSPEAMEILRSYRWPGNVRELQNVIRQAVLKTNGPVIIPEFLPNHIVRRVRRENEDPRQSTDGHAAADSLEQLIESKLRSGSEQVYDEVISVVEEQLVEHVLAYTGGDKLTAIRKLGVNPMAFRSMAALKLFDLGTVPVAQVPATNKSGNSSGEDDGFPSAEKGDAPTPAGATPTERPSQSPAVQSTCDPCAIVDGERSDGERDESERGGTSSAEPPPLIRPGMTMEEIEKEAIRRALLQTQGKRTAAAQLLGISVRTLQRKLKEYDLNL